MKLPKWKGPIDFARPKLTSTVASAPVDDNSLTLEKLLRVMKDLPPAQPRITELRCNPRMVPDARLAGYPVVVSEIVPDGYILVIKPGLYGPEIAGIIGPEKKS